MQKFEIVTASTEETRKIGVVLGRVLNPGDIICLTGDLGAGKTAFVSGIAQGLEITEPVTSPTFTIVNEYKGRIPFFHFDVYRVYDPDELFEIGFEEYFSRGGAVCIEWANLIEDMLPESRLDISIMKVPGEENDSKRIISIKQNGQISAGLEEAILFFKEDMKNT